LISRFFIDRPIFAAVLSIVITLAGGIAMIGLPIAQYPQITPPTVQVDCNYPGASAEVVSESVATPIEQQVNGVEDMLYMASQCTNDGTYNLTVTFRQGVNLNMALVMVQNRVALALPMLPDVLKQTGVNVKKKAPDILMAIAFNSPNTPEAQARGEVRNQLFLSNYVSLQIKDEIARMPGVSDVTIFGQRDFSMRVWVDPDLLAARSLSAGDIANAIREQNLPAPSGQIGQPPAVDGQPIQIPLNTLGRLTDVKQFENIIIKATADGRLLRLKDVAKVEIGALNQDINCQVNGKPSVGMAIFQLPDANALDVADVLKAKVKEMSTSFPPGVEYEIRYDTTPYIRESINEVFKTLRDAVILVAVVVLLFLQNWRSAIIPLIAVPVAIIGTFAAMLAFGFSLNNLTLFGLVLAIGIVVDDAIVVVEAVEHHIEHGMSPRDATIRAMEEVSGPVIAIGLVLTAVFVPCAFISGIVGQFFRQFALTIAVSTIISAFNSLTLSPALTALLLKPRGANASHGAALPRVVYAVGGGLIGYLLLAEKLTAVCFSFLQKQHVSIDYQVLHQVIQIAAPAACLIAGWLLGPAIDWLLRGFFRLFNFGFRKATGLYGMIVGGLLRVSLLALLVYAGLLVVTYWGFMTTPAGFIPSQDMGYLLVNVQLPDSASTERTQEAMDKIERIAKQTPGCRHTQTMTGTSMLLSANGSNFGSMFVMLDPFDVRREMERANAEAWEKLSSEEQTRLRELPVEKQRDEKGQILRPSLDLRGEMIQKELRYAFEKFVPEAMLTVLGPPPVRGVGRAGGFKIMVEDRGDSGPRSLQLETERLAQATTDTPNPVFIEEDKLPIEPAKRGQSLIGLAKDHPAFVAITSVFRANVPQLFFDVDRTEARTKEVSIGDLFDTLRIYLGSLYVNDINLFGRTWRVTVQAIESYRNTVDDVARLKVRNASGKMVPLGTIASVRMKPGPQILIRYNMYPAAPINGAAAPGMSSRQAIDVLNALSHDPDNLSPAFAPEWTELAFLEIQAGNTAMAIFGVSVLMVFLVLAAQYESWSLPLAIILVVPMCLFSAIIGVRIAGQDVNIFTQIGFVVLVGLASKNAILIVEFAKQRREEGETARQAALDACLLRLRPIIMTSLAFIFGVLPLIVSQGAGAEMRRTLGTTVFSGMLGVTLFGIFLTPIFFYVIDVLGETSLFQSRLVRRFNSITLGLLSFRYVREAARSLSRRPSPPTPKPIIPASPPELVPDELIHEIELNHEAELIEQK
jgi:multidrug efflux pump